MDPAPGCPPFWRHPPEPDWSTLAPIGQLDSIERSGAGIRATTEAGPLTAVAFAPGIFRLTLGEPRGPDYGIVVAQPAAPAVVVTQSPDGVVLAAGDWRLGLRRRPLSLELWHADERLLGSTTDAVFSGVPRLPGFARAGDGWFVALALTSGEPVYGHGEKWGPLNHRGQLLRSRVEDALGVNAEASYKNAPLAWSPRGWGVFVHTAASVTHGVGHPAWSHRSYALVVEDDALDLFLITGTPPAAILERYTWLTGRPRVPPGWSLGAWFSRAYYKDAPEVLATARRLRERRIPADVIVLDGRAWQETETRFTFNFDPARYPEPRAVLDELHALGFKVCVWEYPLVSVHGPLFADLEAKGYLLNDPETGRAYIHQWRLVALPDSGLIDFTHPEAYAYWRDGHAQLFDLGVDVIKCDFGEQVPERCTAWNGDRGDRLHNVYPLLYQQCVAEATLRARGHGFVFARSGWAGSQRWPTHWGGDPQADWEALAASIRGALSFGLTGGACYATDVGGFYGGAPDAELYVRWTQAAVFASHLRFHGITPREPWIFGDEAEAIVRSWLEVRYRLVPYLEHCLEEAAASGMPVMRAMPLAFPDEPELWAADTQYLLGDELLVAPILQPGGGIRIQLPRGRWREFSTGESFTGGRSLALTYPLEQFPVFVRGDAALPLGPVMQHTGQSA